jgi:hypothetical protein
MRREDVVESKNRTREETLKGRMKTTTSLGVFMDQGEMLLRH